jgi:hypothetical protein
MISRRNGASLSGILEPIVGISSPSVMASRSPGLADKRSLLFCPGFKTILGVQLAHVATYSRYSLMTTAVAQPSAPRVKIDR